MRTIREAIQENGSILVLSVILLLVVAAMVPYAGRQETNTQNGASTVIGPRGAK